jgi:1-acyl-sn-glycerol-3-phosphate acyltransferase
VLFLRSLLFALGWAASTVVFAPLSVLTFPLPVRARYRIISQWSRFSLWWLRLTCRVHYTIEGREHIPPGPAVILCKHQSAWETLALQRIFPPVVWVLKRSLLWIPFFGWGLAMLRPIAIERGAGRKALRALVDQGTARLREGWWVVVFPEGTRVAPGERGVYQAGGALLAERSGYPVVPVAHNAGELWGKQSFYRYPGTIRVVIGPPIETVGRRATEINALAEQWIEARMAEIAGTAREPSAGDGAGGAEEPAIPARSGDKQRGS